MTQKEKNDLLIDSLQINIATTCQDLEVWEEALRRCEEQDECKKASLIKMVDSHQKKFYQLTELLNGLTKKGKKKNVG